MQFPTIHQYAAGLVCVTTPTPLGDVRVYYHDEDVIAFRVGTGTVFILDEFTVENDFINHEELTRLIAHVRSIYAHDRTHSASTSTLPYHYGEEMKAAELALVE